MHKTFSYKSMSALSPDYVWPRIRIFMKHIYTFFSHKYNHASLGLEHVRVHQDMDVVW